jgi:hypothetical protein
MGVIADILLKIVNIAGLILILASLLAFSFYVVYIYFLKGMFSGKNKGVRKDV